MEEYQYEATLGEGAYGYVWKCRQAATGRTVAVKGLKSAHEVPEIMRMAVREVKVLRGLSHPNIVPLLDAFRSRSGRVYMVFPYIGPSCFQAMEGHEGCRMPARRVRLIAWQLLHALAHLHARQVVHRDIKPANVLLSGGSGGSDGPERAVLIDFGFARATRCGPRDAERLSSYVVTRWYRAPEVLLRQHYGPAADMWSLGCTLAELLGGWPLFPGTSTMDQLYRISRCLGPLPRAAADPPPAPAPSRGSSLRSKLPPDLDAGLFALLEACLATDPRVRPTAAQLLQSPCFWAVPRLVAGTPLEGLYDRRAGEGGNGGDGSGKAGGGCGAAAAAAAAAAAEPGRSARAEAEEGGAEAGLGMGAGREAAEGPVTPDARRGGQQPGAFVAGVAEKAAEEAAAAAARDAEAAGARASGRGDGPAAAALAEERMEAGPATPPSGDTAASVPSAGSSAGGLEAVLTARIAPPAPVTTAAAAAGRRAAPAKEPPDGRTVPGGPAAPVCGPVHVLRGSPTAPSAFASPFAAADQQACWPQLPPIIAPSPAHQLASGVAPRACAAPPRGRPRHAGAAAGELAAALVSAPAFLPPSADHGELSFFIDPDAALDPEAALDAPAPAGGSAAQPALGPHSLPHSYSPPRLSAPRPHHASLCSPAAHPSAARAAAAPLASPASPAPPASWATLEAGPSSGIPLSADGGTPPFCLHASRGSIASIPPPGRACSQAAAARAGSGAAQPADQAAANRRPQSITVAFLYSVKAHRALERSIAAAQSPDADLAACSPFSAGAASLTTCDTPAFNAAHNHSTPSAATARAAAGPPAPGVGPRRAAAAMPAAASAAAAADGGGSRSGSLHRRFAAPGGGDGWAGRGAVLTPGSASSRDRQTAGSRWSAVSSRGAAPCLYGVSTAPVRVPGGLDTFSTAEDIEAELAQQEQGEAEEAEEGTAVLPEGSRQARQSSPSGAAESADHRRHRSGPGGSGGGPGWSWRQLQQKLRRSLRRPSRAGHEAATWAAAAAREEGAGGGGRRGLQASASGAGRHSADLAAGGALAWTGAAQHGSERSAAAPVAVAAPGGVLLPAPPRARSGALGLREAARSVAPAELLLPARLYGAATAPVRAPQPAGEAQAAAAPPGRRLRTGPGPGPGTGRAGATSSAASPGDDNGSGVARSGTSWSSAASASGGPGSFRSPLVALGEGGGGDGCAKGGALGPGQLPQARSRSRLSAFVVPAIHAPSSCEDSAEGEGPLSAPAGPAPGWVWAWGTQGSMVRSQGPGLPRSTSTRRRSSAMMPIGDALEECEGGEQAAAAEGGAGAEDCAGGGEGGGATGGGEREMREPDCDGSGAHVGAGGSEKKPRGRVKRLLRALAALVGRSKR